MSLLPPGSRNPGRGEAGLTTMASRNSPHSTGGGLIDGTLLRCWHRSSAGDPMPDMARLATPDGCGSFRRPCLRLPPVREALALERFRQPASSGEGEITSSAVDVLISAREVDPEGLCTAEAYLVEAATRYRSHLGRSLHLAPCGPRMPGSRVLRTGARTRLHVFRRSRHGPVDEPDPETGTVLTALGRLIPVRSQEDVRPLHRRACTGESAGMLDSRSPLWYRASHVRSPLTCNWRAPAFPAPPLFPLPWTQLGRRTR